ncbi:MAG TPA: DNA polymerase ligase N-terminal domain-containing protein [Verrucomicrobiae bacterium]|nr:DNA polymerase ligase N-terminal domain-containing protein [Verrucomicrobiae bacterium]
MKKQPGRSRMKNGLQAYQAKRDFNQTREPAGTRPGPARKHRSLQFVVQKHDASHLHYDFRLEMNGVLKSWAVPKGIPLDKGEPRLAMEVEDHPLEYGRFEGVIPPGNYGAGTVQLWDRGKYEATDAAPADALRKGKLSFVLHGKKLNGHWTLVRTRREDGVRNSWLLIKTGENVPRQPTEEMERSVRSGKTLEELSHSRHVWKSSRKGGSAAAPTSFKARIQRMVARKQHRA